MANAKSIYLEGTTRTVAKSVAEATAVVGRIPGVVRTSQEYGPGAEIAAILFDVELGGKTLRFEVRPSPKGVRSQWRKLYRHKPLSDDKAIRIAWAQALEWVKVQAALIESEQRDVVSAFLPQLQQPSGIGTLADHFIETELKRLPAGGAS